MNSSPSSTSTTVSINGIDSPLRVAKPTRIINAAAIVGVALLAFFAVACGGDDGSKDATRAVAISLSTNLLFMQDECFGDLVIPETCQRWVGRVASVCTAVATEGVAGEQDADYEGAKWSEFDGWCDDFDVALATPRFLAEAEFVRLRQDVRAIGDRHE